MNTSGVHFSFLLYQSYLAGRNDWELPHAARDTTVERTMHDLAYTIGDTDRMRLCMGDKNVLKMRSEVLSTVRDLLQLDEAIPNSEKDVV